MERFQGWIPLASVDSHSNKAGAARATSGGFGTNWSGPTVFPDVQWGTRPQQITGGDLGSPPRTLLDRIQIFPWIAFIPRGLKFNFPGQLLPYRTGRPAFFPQEL